MRVNPVDSTDGLFAYEINTNYYSSLEYIFKYVKEGIIPALFPKDFIVSEFHTNLTSTELTPNNGGDKFEDETEKQSAASYSRPNNSVGINVALDVTDPKNKNIPNMTVIGNTQKTVHSHSIMRDNLFSLQYLPNKFSYNIDCHVYHEDKMSLENLFGSLYSRIMQGSFFYLNRNINLKIVISKEFISILHLIYEDLTMEDFMVKLEKMTNGTLIIEEDLISGDNEEDPSMSPDIYGKTIFGNFSNNPLIRIDSLTIEEKKVRFSIRLELQMPNHIFMECMYTYAELQEMLFEKVTLGDISVLSDEDKKRAVNLDISFINDNREFFPDITDEEIIQYNSGDLKFYLDWEGVDVSLFEFMGMIGGVNATLENLETNIELAPDEAVVNEMFASVESTTYDYSEKFDKVKTVVYNFTSFPKDTYRIDDSIGEAYARANDPTKYLIVVMDDNGKRLPYSITQDDNSNYILNFKKDLNTMTSINYFKSKDI